MIELVSTSYFRIDTVVLSSTIVEKLRPLGPNREPLSTDWVERHLGVVSRHLDVDVETLQKREGGFSTVDMLEIAVRRTLDSTSIVACDIDAFVVYNLYPDNPSLQYDLSETASRLGMSPATLFLEVSSGCASIAHACLLVTSLLGAESSYNNVLVAAVTNASGRLYDDAIKERHLKHQRPFSWYVYVLMVDGASAALFRRTQNSEGSATRGLLRSQHKSHFDKVNVTDFGGRLPQAQSTKLRNRETLAGSTDLWLIDAPSTSKDLQVLYRESFDWLRSE